jgi:hypothetical protein
LVCGRRLVSSGGQHCDGQDAVLIAHERSRFYEPEFFWQLVEAALPVSDPAERDEPEAMAFFSGYFPKQGSPSLRKETPWGDGR